MTITGTIVFPKNVPTAACTVYVRLLDTSMLDAPAVTIAANELSWEASNMRNNELPFALEVKDIIDERADYTLFVHADLDHDRELSANDLMYSQSYPIITKRQFAKNLRIVLNKI